MKTTTPNHNEILKKLEVELVAQKKERKEAFKIWRLTKDNELKHLVYTHFKTLDNAVEKLEQEINFHKIMLQEKRYATEWLWSDVTCLRDYRRKERNNYFGS